MSSRQTQAASRAQRNLTRSLNRFNRTLQRTTSQTRNLGQAISGIDFSTAGLVRMATAGPMERDLDIRQAATNIGANVAEFSQLFTRLLEAGLEPSTAIAVSREAAQAQMMTGQPLGASAEFLRTQLQRMPAPFAAEQFPGAGALRATGRFDLTRPGMGAPTEADIRRSSEQNQLLQATLNSMLTQGGRLGAGPIGAARRAAGMLGIPLPARNDTDDLGGF